MEEIKQEVKICIGANYSVERAIGSQSNNYASSYAIPLLEKKGHNGPHESHIHNFVEKK